MVIIEFAMKRVYYNELECDCIVKSTKQKCANGAYFATHDGHYRCGVHSKEATRQVLPKNPNANALRSQYIQAFVQSARVAAQQNKDQHLIGRVCASPLLRQKEARFKPRPGFLPIFPNYKHTNGYRYLDELGKHDFSQLSPRKLGPVVNEHDGTVIALNIENYHQFAKVFADEQDKTQEPCGCALALPPNGKQHYKPLPAYYEARRLGYADQKSHRHKLPIDEIKKQQTSGGSTSTSSSTTTSTSSSSTTSSTTTVEKETKKTAKQKVNEPVYSIHFLPDGSEIHLTYIQSRYFYCHQMERLALQRPEFGQLRQLREQQGFNIEIVGYDAFDATGVDAQSLYNHYIDPSRPFGHEMVILCLLVLGAGDDPTQYPWNVFQRLHPLQQHPNPNQQPQ